MNLQFLKLKATSNVSMDQEIDKTYILCYPMLLMFLVISGDVTVQSSFSYSSPNLYIGGTVATIEDVGLHNQNISLGPGCHKPILSTFGIP